MWTLVGVVQASPGKNVHTHHTPHLLSIPYDKCPLQRLERRGWPLHENTTCSKSLEPGVPSGFMGCDPQGRFSDGGNAPGVLTISAVRVSPNSDYEQKSDRQNSAVLLSSGSDKH